MSEALLIIAAFLVGWWTTEATRQLRRRHRHQWTETGRVYTASRLTEAESLTEDLAQQMAFGVTSIELRCECGQVTERRLLGNHT